MRYPQTNQGFRRSRHNRKLLFVLLIGMALVLSLGDLRTSHGLPRVQAAVTLTVDSTVDDTLANLATNTTCDLREAIEATNTNTTVGQCAHDGSLGSDTIRFAPAAYGTITLTEGQLVITSDLTIAGPGA